MSSVPGRIFFLSPKLSTSHAPRLHLLVPQGRHGSNGNGASEIVRRELCRL
jgi:hypothetical protein